jgi:hypothetical protein
MCAECTASRMSNEHSGVSVATGYWPQPMFDVAIVCSGTTDVVYSQG